MFPGFVRYEHMISKASLSNFVFLFLFSLLAHAEETSGMGSADGGGRRPVGRMCQFRPTVLLVSGGGG